MSRLASTEELAGMDMLCSNKTGTLTPNIISFRGVRLQSKGCCCLVHQSSCPGAKGDKPNNVWSGLKHLRTHEHDERTIAVREEHNCTL